MIWLPLSKKAKSHWKGIHRIQISTGHVVIVCFGGPGPHFYRANYSKGTSNGHGLFADSRKEIFKKLRLIFAKENPQIDLVRQRILSRNLYSHGDVDLYNASAHVLSKLNSP